MDDRPLVSIGMPVYNGERYVADAIRSILRQTVTDLELIISDNASTDRTSDICRNFAALDDRVRYLKNKQNVGAHPNYNITWEHATGEYFKWAAHDDLLEPTYLERCLASLNENPDAVVCQSYVHYIDEDGTRLGVYDSALYGSGSKDAATRFGSVILLPHAAYEIMGVFRRRAMENGLLLQSFHGADRALLAELSLRERFLQVPEPLFNARDHEQRYTRSVMKPKERAVWHDAQLAGKFSLPTWRLYSEYWKMVGRNVHTGWDKSCCCLKLLKWWFVNWNAARMLIDIVAVPFPNSVFRAESFKQRVFSPQPGAGQTRSKRGGSAS